MQTFFIHMKSVCDYDNFNRKIIYFTSFANQRIVEQRLPSLTVLANLSSIVCDYF